MNYDPEHIYIVSVSDDHTARLWTTADNKHVATLKLTSPGMSACWHKDDNSKLLIAEKIGVIRFYNVSKQKPILSLDYGKPLASAHWAPFDSQLIASLQMGELLLWDMTHSRYVIYTYFSLQDMSKIIMHDWTVFEKHMKCWLRYCTCEQIY